MIDMPVFIVCYDFGIMENFQKVLCFLLCQGGSACGQGEAFRSVALKLLLRYKYSKH